MNESAGSRIQHILDEMVRVTDGLLHSHVSFDTVMEYLDETIDELTQEDVRKVLIFAIVDIIREQKARTDE